MFERKRVLIVPLLTLFVFAFSAPTVAAKKPSEYDAIVGHLKTKYKAKKVKIPFMWLARFAVGVVRPAGVKSFSVTLFDNLKVSRDTLDREMQDALKQTFSPEWSSVFRVRTRDGQQVYMYMREAGKNVRVTLVTIEKEKAAIIRATFSPEKLIEFTNDPKILGISLNEQEKPRVDPLKPSEANNGPKNETTRPKVNEAPVTKPSL